MNQAELQQALSTAAQAQRAGHADEATRLYQSVIARAGEQPVALNALGIQALGARDFAAAADFFRRAIAVDQRSPDLWMNLAHARRSDGDEVGEQAALEGALAIDQTHFMALVRMAELHERHGRIAQAAERWSGVLAMAPGIAERSSGLEMMLEHARGVVSRQQGAFAAAIDAGLAEARAGFGIGERRRVDAGIDAMLGRRQIYANQPHGLHVPFLPADEYFERDHFPWLAEIEGKTDVIRAELEALLNTDDPGLTPYVAMAPGTPENKWTPLDNKLDWSALHLWKNGTRDDAACARCPQTAAAVEALPLADIPGRAPTVFFSLLRPGTHLPAHTGVTNVRTVIHLPLIVPGGCRFRVGGETRDWREGEAWAFDDTIDHEAWNDSDAIRAVLIFDTWNPYLSDAERALIRAFFVSADTEGFAVGEMEG